MIGLDTTALIDISKDNNEIIKLINQLNEDICTTIMNHQEIMFGLNLKMEKHREEEKFFDNFFNGMFVFNLDVPSSKNASRVLWDLKEKTLSIEKFDCMIAEILLTNSVNKIITRNVKHFEGIPNLKVISY